MVCDKKLYWIWLNNVPGIGARRFYKLVEYYGSPELLFYATDEDLQTAVKILGDKTFAALREFRRDEELEKARKIMELPNYQLYIVESAISPF